MSSLFIRIAGKVFSRLPLPVLSLLTGVAGLCLYYGFPGYRRLLLSNLHHAFPEQPASWRTKLARRNCRNTVESGLLALILPFCSPERLRKMLLLDEATRDEITRIANNEAPLVILTPHIYSIEILTLLPLVYEKKLPPLGFIYRPLGNPALDNWVRHTRERFGFRLFSRKEGFRQANRLLEQKGGLGILFDQNAGHQGELVLFMGRIASTTGLPELLARKYRARLVAGYGRRLGSFHYQLCVEEIPAQMEETGGVTRRANQWLEELLCSDENAREGWLWLHNRWRTQDKPSHRLQIKHKRRELLDLQRREEGLPRKTRFWIRMPNWLGDIVMALPLVRALRESRPDAEVTLWVPPGAVSLLENLGVAERVRPLPPKGFARWIRFFRLRNEFPDTFLLFTNSLRGDLEAFLTRCPQRFGIIRPGKLRPLLTHGWKMPDSLDEQAEHQTRLWEKFLRHFGLGVPPVRTPLRMEPSDEFAREGDLVIGMICGTENFPAKRWPVAHWRKLLGDLLSAVPECRILLLGTRADQAITSLVAEGFENERVRDLAGKTTLLEFASLLAGCRMVVSNDTGGMHLANLLGIPVVALYGPTNPIRTGPIFEAPCSLLQPPGCPEHGGGSLADLLPEEVSTEVKALLPGKNPR